MGSARYVGRVGALAVALGVGVAVATTGPAVAWGQPASSDGSGSGSGSNNDTSSGTSMSGAASTSESASTPTRASDAKVPNRTRGDRVGPLQVARDSIEALTDRFNEGLPRLDLDSSARGRGPVRETDDAPEADMEPVGDEDPGGAGSTRRSATRHSVFSAPVTRSAPTHTADDPDLITARVLPAESAPPSGPPRSVLPAASRPVSTEGTAVLAAVSSPPPAPPAPPTRVSGAVSQLLAAVGLSPSAAPDPVAPMETPLFWAVLAWVRRQYAVPSLGEARVGHPRQSSQSVDDSGDVVGVRPPTAPAAS